MEKRIHWQGDFENEPKSGSIVSRSGTLVTIKWDDGSQMMVPEIVTTGSKWRVE